MRLALELPGESSDLSNSTCCPKPACLPDLFNSFSNDKNKPLCCTKFLYPEFDCVSCRPLIFIEDEAPSTGGSGVGVDIAGVVGGRITGREGRRRTSATIPGRVGR